MYSLQEKIIAHFIFSNEQFIAKLTELHQLNLDISNNLFKRLGVQEKRDKRVTMLVISDDSFAGFDTLFTLAIACEKAFKKSVDTDLMRVVVFRTLDEARKSSHLEHANFIFIPDENLLDVESYPELEKILPFKKRGYKSYTGGQVNTWPPFLYDILYYFLCVLLRFYFVI